VILRRLEKSDEGLTDDWRLLLSGC
jgi:hypothetical protein